MKKMMAITMCMMMLASLFSGMGIAEGSTLAKIDMTKWQYETSDDVYWQVGLSYAADPADSGYETMGVFVPGAYFTATDNGDGTWTCAVNAEGTVGAYTAETAPLVLPVNTPGYSAMSAPTGYDSAMGYGSVSDYTNEGIMGYWGAGLQGARQPKGAIYTVWDSNWREELEYQTLDHTALEPSGADMITRQLRQVEEFRRMEDRKLPEDINYI